MHEAIATRSPGNVHGALSVGASHTCRSTCNAVGALVWKARALRCVLHVNQARALRCIFKLRTTGKHAFIGDACAPGYEMCSS